MELVDYSVLPRNIFNDVYEPSEDTFILIDALEKDIEFINNKRPTICLEIGCGSGVVTSSVGKVLGPIYYLCTDLNPVAASATKVVSESNNVSVEIVITDLVNVFETRLQNSVDLLIFNPPYAVSPSDEINGDYLQKATSGGEKGREVMDRIFPVIPKLLSPNGIFYLTCIIQNDIKEIAHCLSTYNLEMTVVLHRRCGIERLYVLRFCFKTSRL